MNKMNFILFILLILSKIICHRIYKTVFLAKYKTKLLLQRKFALDERFCTQF